MTAQITPEIVKKLAELSRLSFSTEQEQIFLKEFQSIVGFVEQIQTVDTTGVEPMAGTLVNASTFERADTVTFTDNRDSLMKTAPKAEMGFYVVPKVVE